MRELACPRGPHSEGWWEQVLTLSQTSFPRGAHLHGRECPRSAGACWTFHGTPGPCRVQTPFFLKSAQGSSS